jgi:hypothetical protein|tara:strand:- start:43 stop:420 length:378 start_codon:yes stop_codon:yes gene_type:complete
MKSKNNNKSFGILFFIVFLIIGLWPLLNLNPIRIWSLIISLIFLILAFFKPEFLKPLNSIWMKFGELLGRVIAPIVMFVIFFLVVTPLSFLVRLFGKDLLNIKFNNSKSYWLKKKNDNSSMKKQF